MRNNGKPIILRVKGYCIGGGNELNVLCDLTISGASGRFGWMTVLDWNSYSRNHSSWFASDSIHLSAAGAVPLLARNGSRARSGSAR